MPYILLLRMLATAFAFATTRLSPLSFRRGVGRPCKKSCNKTFRFYRPYGICHNFLTLPLLCESSHRQYIDEFYKFNTTVFTKMESRLQMSHRLGISFELTVFSFGTPKTSFPSVSGFSSSGERFDMILLCPSVCNAFPPSATFDFSLCPSSFLFNHADMVAEVSVLFDFLGRCSLSFLDL